MTTIKFMKLHSLPEAQRPREKLLQKGINALSTDELVAILLGTGTRGKPVLVLAQELLHHFGGIDGLSGASVQELLEVKGIGRAKAIQLVVAFEMRNRQQRKVFLPGKYRVRTAQEAYELAHSEIGQEQKEIAFVILKDAKEKLIHQERIAVGTLTEVLVHPREVFYPAIKHKAHSLIIAHNHPSGDPTPSQTDLELTRMLIQSSRVVGIHLDDHLIIGDKTFVSLREKGYFGLRS